MVFTKELMRLINMEYTKSMIKFNAQIYKNYYNV